MDNDKTSTTGLVCSILGIVLGFISIFVFWWLSFIGLILSIIGFCCGENKVLGGIGIGICGILVLITIILLCL